jgi:uncharacterized protein
MSAPPAFEGCGRICLAVIKAVRACNLRCPYCYYINEDTPGYGKIIQEHTLRLFYAAVAAHIGPQDRFEFVWHGGEPMLLGTRRFRRYIEIQSEYLAPAQTVNVMQTNGTLITAEWCELLRELQVGIGVSLDGPPQVHDRRRPRVRGGGSYAETVRGIELMQKSGTQVGVLCVADPLADGRAVLSHFCELGIPECDFLIPISNNCLDAHPNTLVTDHAHRDALRCYYLDAFDEWKRRKGAISVRLFDSLIQNAFGIPHGDLNAGSTNIAENVILETDGQICLDPDFWYVDRFAFGKAYRLEANVHDADFLLDTVADRLDTFAAEQRLRNIPSDCQTCAMRSVCRASHPASRYGIDGSFNHRSAYCHLTYDLSCSVVSLLLDFGLARYLVDPDLRRAVVNHQALVSQDTRAVQHAAHS